MLIRGARAQSHSDKQFYHSIILQTGAYQTEIQSLSKFKAIQCMYVSCFVRDDQEISTNFCFKNVFKLFCCGQTNFMCKPKKFEAQ